MGESPRLRPAVTPSRHPRLLLVFLDGVGVGKNDPLTNPFALLHLPSFERLSGGTKILRGRSRLASSRWRPVDATLGVQGLPQSGTGQTALLTGANAAKIVGRHFGPYPYSTLRPVLDERNLFRQLYLLGRKVHYANAFPPQYFAYVERHKSRSSAFTHAWLSSGFRLNTLKELEAGKAVSADVTGAGLRKLGYPSLPVVEPAAAGERLARMLHEYDAVVYEHFLTDHAGHGRSMAEATDVLQRLDAMFGGIIASFDPGEMLLVVTSDHGNIEDLSVKTHTRNPVPLLAWGKGAHEMLSKVRRLTHIAPALVDLMS